MVPGATGTGTSSPLIIFSDITWKGMKTIKIIINLLISRKHIIFALQKRSNRSTIFAVKGDLLLRVQNN
jgi:hypothetical protein